jgi:hypothetical protein
MVWYDNTPGTYQIYYKKWSGFMTLSSKVLTWSPVNCYDPDIVVDSAGDIHVVFCDDTPGNAEIYYLNSTNGGLTWRTKKRLSWTSGPSEFPAVIADPSGDLHVVWQDETPGNFEIYYRRYIK